MKKNLPYLALVAAGLAGRVCNMDRSALPQLSFQAPRNFTSDLASGAVERWNPHLAAKSEGEGEDDSSISIYDIIGKDFWTGEGVTAKRISAALRTIGSEKNIVVNINSPGGDLFEGIAIYNMLRDHKGKVTTRVLGVAASSASIIAMAGDEIQIARAGFMMIHNAWVMGAGDRNDFLSMAETLGTFDSALAEVYSARTGKDKKAIAKMMDKETWFSGSEAIEEGFATSLVAGVVEEKEPKTDEEKAMASADMRVMDIALARSGVSRSDRRAMMNRIRSMPKAAATGTPSAATEDTALAAGEVVQSLSELAAKPFI